MTNKIQDPEVKAKWIATLRSGKYVQGKEALEMDGCNCCLGVLCRIYPDVKVLEYNPAGKTPFKYKNGLADCNYLPAELGYEIFGESIGNPYISFMEGNKEKLDKIAIKYDKHCLSPEINGVTLATLNDSGWSFEMIADVIEEFL